MARGGCMVFWNSFKTALETHSQPPPLEAFTSLLAETTRLLALLRPQARPQATTVGL